MKPPHPLFSRSIAIGSLGILLLMLTYFVKVVALLEWSEVHLGELALTGMANLLLPQVTLLFVWLLWVMNRDDGFVNAATFFTAGPIWLYYFTHVFIVDTETTPCNGVGIAFLMIVQLAWILPTLILVGCGKIYQYLRLKHGQANVAL